MGKFVAQLQLYSLSWFLRAHKTVQFPRPAGELCGVLTF